eukprot:gene8092-481_t
MASGDVAPFRRAVAEEEKELRAAAAGHPKKLKEAEDFIGKMK